MIKIEREPTHPGEILKEEFLIPLNISQTFLADALGVSFRAVNELVNQKRGITVEMAIRLSKYFKTTPELWLNLQNQYELYKVSKKKQSIFEKLEPCEKIVA
jgi:addiction module HigA family antidote